jgi:group I intron endonuclease
MNGIVYRILNKKNGKIYVGQTVRSLKKRYPLAWWKKSHNLYLKNSIEKHGIDSFEWEILEDGIDSVSKLNELEGYYADKFNSYIPNGYNITKCGNNRLLNEETKQKISKTNSKKHFLKDCLGNLYEIDCLSEFCKKRGLHRGAIINLLTKRSNYSQGFVRADDSPLPKMAKVYCFVSPNGDVIKGTITEVSRKYGINNWTLANLVHGHLKTSKGWALL